MKVLVTYASRHGATQGIAEQIAETLRTRGLDVTLRTVTQAGDPSSFDAFVIGSAAYMNHWLGDAGFVRRHRAVLASRPLWLFSSGPTGTDLVDRKGRDSAGAASLQACRRPARLAGGGRDVRVASEPAEFAEFREALHPRGDRVFFGAYDVTGPPIGLADRVVRILPASWRAAIPSGDFRDWADIEAWALAIADDLDRQSPHGRQPPPEDVDGKHRATVAAVATTTAAVNVVVLPHAK
jgi:menaquinone-dependent protoporphyrinogen oxidase